MENHEANAATISGPRTATASPKRVFSARGQWWWMWTDMPLPGSDPDAPRREKYLYGAFSSKAAAEADMARY